MSRMAQHSDPEPLSGHISVSEIEQEPHSSGQVCLIRSSLAQPGFCSERLGEDEPLVIKVGGAIGPFPYGDRRIQRGVPDGR